MGPTEPCLSREWVRIVRVENDRVTFSHDDGRFTWELELVESPPEALARLQLEGWDGELVSLWDPSVERRYRTDRWPVASWGSDGVTMTAFGSLMLYPLVWILIAYSLQGLRRRMQR